MLRSFSFGKKSKKAKESGAGKSAGVVQNLDGPIQSLDGPIQSLDGPAQGSAEVPFAGPPSAMPSPHYSQPAGSSNQPGQNFGPRPRSALTTARAICHRPHKPPRSASTHAFPNARDLGDPVPRSHTPHPHPHLACVRSATHAARSAAAAAWRALALRRAACEGRLREAVVAAPSLACARPTACPARWASPLLSRAMAAVTARCPGAAGHG